MNLTSGTMWLSIALLLITTVILFEGTLITVIATKTVRRRNTNVAPVLRHVPRVLNIAALLGYLPLLVRKGLRDVIHDQQTKLGSVFTVSLFRLKVTFLIGPEVSAHFYRGSDSEISQGNIYKFTVPLFGPGVGYDVDLATRNEQTRFYSDALKPLKLRTYVDPMVQEVEGYFARWGQHGTADLKHELEQVLVLIAGRCLLGKEAREKMFDEVCTLFHELDSGMHLISVFFPYLPIPAHRRRDKAHARLTEIFSEIVRSRTNSGRAEEDMLQSLIDSKYRDGRPTTETEIIGVILGMLFGGKHTSSNTSTWTGACLLNHPKHLVAAIEEQKQIIRQHGDHIDYDSLLKMNTLHCCIKEALRIHPPVLMLVRQVHKCFTVRTKEGNEYDIPKGHTVVSPIVLNNQLPYIYKDPYVYDPDRFGPGREEDKVGGPLSYMAFSAGRHTCIGEGYAYMQIKVIWSHLLRNFELKLISPFPKTDWNQVVPGPKGKVMVGYKRRKLPST